MDWILFAQSDLFKWVILPLMIIAARLCDVSLGTMRVIFIGKGYRFLAPLIGYFCADRRDHAPGKLVFNRTLGLHDPLANLGKSGKLDG